MTLVPIKIYFDKSNKCKIQIDVCKGKHTYDKRQDLKEKQVKLDINRELKKTKVKEKRNKSKMANVYLDCETSGLKPGQIGQITIITEESNGKLSTYNEFFEMEQLSKGASEVTGRTLADYIELANGQEFKDKALEIYTLVNGNTIIGHNVQFDLGFITAELSRAGVEMQEQKQFDTLKYMDGTYKGPDGRFKKPKLVELREYFSINDNEIQKFCHELFTLDADVAAHDSIYDTTLTFVITKVMWEYKYGVGSYVNRFVNK